MAKLSIIIDKIDHISEKIAVMASFLTFFMMLLVVYEVSARYFADSPTVWSMELCQFAFTYIIALGGAYTLQTGGRVSVDILYNRLSARVQSILDIITTFLVLVFLIALTWQTGLMSLEALSGGEHTGTAFNPPTFPAKVVIPIGVFFLVLQGIALLARRVAQALSGGNRKEHTDVLKSAGGK